MKIRYYPFSEKIKDEGLGPYNIWHMPLSDLAMEDLSACFDLPARDAAKKLGMCLTSLKKLMRKFGISRWYLLHWSFRM